MYLSCMYLFTIYNTPSWKTKATECPKETDYWPKICSFLIPVSLQPDFVNLLYFKRWPFDPAPLMVWIYKGLRHQVSNIRELEIRNFSDYISLFLFFICIKITSKKYENNIKSWKRSFKVKVKIFVFSFEHFLRDGK